MKRILTFCTYTFLLLSVAGMFGSCKKDFLEINPKGKLVAKKVNDYQLLASSLDLLNMETISQVAMGDDVAAMNSYFIGTSLHTQRLFKWDAVIYESNEDAVELTVPLRNLYTYNKIINEVMDAADGTPEQKKSIRAQAMAGRAWTNFLLINYYGLPYNGQSSSTDPGFPMITKADVNETSFNRGTVKQMYDFIVSDLVTAIPDLPAQTIHRLRMSKAAGEGLLGKVYVFMHRFDLALPQLKASVADMATAAIPVRLYDYNVEFGTGGSFLPISSFGPSYPTAPNIQENVFAKQFINDYAFASNDLFLSPATAALFSSNDLRLKFFVNTPYPAGAPLPAGLLRKNSISVQFGVVVPDVYLLEAECLARLGDLPGAKNTVENFRRNRMPAGFEVPGAISSDQVKLVRFILEERQREFALEGYRWFDMRRLSVDPEYKTTVTYTHHIYNNSGLVTGSYTLKPERLVMRFPQKVMDQNPGMQNNL